MEEAKNVELLVFASIPSFLPVSPPRGGLPGIAEAVWRGVFPVARRDVSPAAGRSTPPAEERGAPEEAKNAERFVFAPISPPLGGLPGIAEAVWRGASPTEGHSAPPAEERGAPEAAKNVERFVFAFVLSFPLVSPPQGSLPGVAEVVWCGAFPVAVRWASFAEGDCAPPAKRRAGAETLKCIGRGAVCPAPEGAEQPAKAARVAARQSGGSNPLPAFPAHRASVQCHAPAGAFPRANGVGRAEEPKKSPPPGPCRSASFAPAARQRMAHSSSGTPRPVRADTAHTGRPSRPDSSRASGKRSSSSQKLKTSSTRCCRTCASSSRSTASCRAASVASRTATSRSGTPGDAAERAVGAAAAALDCPATC